MGTFGRAGEGLLMVSYAGGGGATEILEGGICPPVPPGLRPVSSLDYLTSPGIRGLVGHLW